MGMGAPEDAAVDHPGEPDIDGVVRAARCLVHGVLGDGTGTDHLAGVGGGARDRGLIDGLFMSLPLPPSGVYP